MARTKGHPIDVLVGQNLLRIRKDVGFSQTALGDALGITFQQVQKYERGANRISASTLYQLSKILNVSLDQLFTGADNVAAENPAFPATGRVYPTTDVERIQNPDVRKVVRSLVRLLSIGEKDATEL